MLAFMSEHVIRPRETNDNKQSMDPAALLRLRQVLSLYPVSRSSWWAGVRVGRYPKPLKLGPRTTAWRRADIVELIERLANEREGER